MRSSILILTFTFFCLKSDGQLKCRGQIFSSITQEPITFGVVRLSSPAGTVGRGKELSRIDSLGFFSISLNDTSGVWIFIDCGLEGNTTLKFAYSDTVVKTYIKTDCYSYNADRAKKDIQNNNIYLLCQLGYVSYKFSSIDSTFMKKYNVTYYTFADEPIMSDCMWLYNSEIANFLDKKYGEIWRNEVRWDVPFKRSKQSLKVQ